MKPLTGWVISAGLILAAGAAQAPVSSHIDRLAYTSVSDLDGPYSEAPPPPRYGYGDSHEYGYGPPVMPPQEIYAVLRDNGFSPLEAPRRRGFIYTIAAIDSEGEDGRLVIDGRNGRILRFDPSYGMGPGFEQDSFSVYGPQGALPSPIAIRGVPRPPMPIPHVARRSVPLPRPVPLAARPAAEPARQAAALRPKPAEATVAAQDTATVGEVQPAAPPVPQIRPTQPMPPVQGLD